MNKKENIRKDSHLDTNNFVLGEIIEENVNDCILFIEDVNKRQNYRGEPIKLYINSTGGVIYDGFALMDIIEMSKVEVHTIAIGKVFSMALPVFLSGHKRFATSRATFMYHEVLWEMPENPMQSHKQAIKESEKLQAQIDEFILSTTDIKKSVLTKIKTTKSELFFSAEEALNWNVIDQIL